MSITLYKKGSLIPNDSESGEIKEKLAQILPIEYVIEWFKARINKTGHENRILVLKASTGSGKSTALPPAIYREFTAHSGDNIAVTEPRVYTTISIVKDQIVGSPHYTFLRLGHNIGWSTGITKKRAQRGLTYMTVGVLLMQLHTMTDEEIMDKYKFIIIDEVHEASIECTNTLFLLKRLIARNSNNPRLPFIVLMSATLEEEKYLHYFGIWKPSERGPGGDTQPNLIKVAGLSYPRRVVFLPENLIAPDYFKAMRDSVEKIHLSGLSDDPGMADILLFLPGAAEIKKVRAELSCLLGELIEAKKPLFCMITINSDAIAKDGEEMEAINMPLNEITVGDGVQPIRRVILATVVAEVGLTINTLKYVVDCGYHRSAVFNPIWGIGGLITEPATQSRITQRIGRAGRKAPGEYHGLFTESTYKALRPAQLSEPQISDCSILILSAINYMDKFSIKDLDILDGPTIDGIQYSFEKLFGLGMICPGPDGWKSTFLGEMTLKLPKIGLEQRRLILGAAAWNISPVDIISMVAYLQVNPKDWQNRKSFVRWSVVYGQGLPEYFKKPGLPERLENAMYDKYRLIIADEFIDGIILFNSIKKIVAETTLGHTNRAIHDFCEKANIPYETMQKFLTIREEVFELTIMAGIDPFFTQSLVDVPENDFMNKITALKHLIYESYRFNFATYVSGIDKYAGRAGIQIAPPHFTEIRKYEHGPAKKQGGAPEPKLVHSVYRPKFIIFEPTHMFKYDPATNCYNVESGRISILDGYVNPDSTFTAPMPE